MADTDALQNYKRAGLPQIPGGDADYLRRQLDDISRSVTLLVSVAKKLEARIAALGG